jgi:hypothetical protein
MATSADSSVRAGKKWHDMTGSERAVFLGKLLVALITFGFVYPNVMTE